MKLKNHKTEPVVANLSGTPDLRVYNVILNIQFGEKSKTSPIVFYNTFGFDSAREALLNLHDTLLTVITRSVSYRSWDGVISPDKCDAWEAKSIEEYLIQLQESSYDCIPGGGDAIDDMEEFGWSANCKLYTGICVTITDFAEEILSSRDIINDVMDVFEGIEQSNGIIYNECVTLQILVVSNVYSKSVSSKLEEGGHSF